MIDNKGEDNVIRCDQHITLGIISLLVLAIVFGVVEITPSIQPPLGTGVTSLQGNYAPVAICSCPSQARVGESINLNGSSSYDPDRTGIWSNATPLPNARRGLAAVVVGDKIYAIGGGIPGPPGKVMPVDWNEVYNPANGTWMSLSPMPTARDVVDAAVVDGKIYVVGGRNHDVSPYGYRMMDEVEVYDPLTNTWEKRRDAPESDIFGLDTVNGTLYALNLRTTDSFTYDRVTDNWTKHETFPLWPYAGPDVWRTVNGRLISAGGLFPYPKGRTWEYNPLNHTWIEVATMPTGRVNAGRTVFGDRLYVVGGQIGGITQVTNTLEEYDQVTDTWRQLPPMSTPRDELASVTLDDELYAIGGRAEPIFFSKVEKYSMKLRYEWDFGDGSPTSEGKVVEHAYASAGTYQVNLTVVDPRGAKGTDTCTIKVLASNRPPVAKAGGPYAGYEGASLTLDASASYDPDNDPLAYRWDFDNDGIADTSWSSSPAITHTWPDDYAGTVRVEVSDNKTTVNATATVTILNLPPTIVSIQIPAFTATATLRISGEKWHDVSAYMVDGDSETLVAKLTRHPGKSQESSFPVSIDLTRSKSIRLEYTPNDDKVNGQRNGATPAWLIFTFDGGGEETFHHTFNVKHADTWNWTISLNQMLAGREVRFTATANDPGMDDLTFTWDWGDGSPATISFYPNGGTFPFTATDEQTHAYIVAGTYDLKVAMRDDDGGLEETMTVIVII